MERVILRSGSSLRIEHLRRVDFSRAAAIILPGADYTMGGVDATDTRVIKTLMTISKYDPAQRHMSGTPLVAEVFDTNRVHIARQAFPGDLEIIASNRFISRLIAQNVHHPGLSFVYAELLSHRYGNEVYLRTCPELAGMAFRDLIGVFDKAVVLGMVRSEGEAQVPLLNPPDTTRLQEDDRIVFIARSYETTLPVARKARAPAQALPDVPPLREAASGRRRLLILGWSHKVVALLDEFHHYEREHLTIDIFSSVPVAERKAPAYPASGPCTVRQLEGDYTVYPELLALDPAAYDSVIFVASDWLDSSEESDARSILGYVLLRSLLENAPKRPQVVIELVDPGNARLFEHRSGEVIISPTVLSHILAHTALRKELSVVFDELFGSSGPEIRFRPAGDFGLDARTMSFREVQRHTAAHREIALGVRLHQPANDLKGGLQLNPPPTAQWTFAPDDRIVVLTTPP
jgi:hypothetical protein